VLALLGLAGTATAAWVTELMPAMIVLSVLLLGRSFYILYVTGRGSRASAVITWLAAAFVAGYWTWRFVADNCS
jgi:hypothetical protein